MDGWMDGLYAIRLQTGLHMCDGSGGGGGYAGPIHGGPSHGLSYRNIYVSHSLNIYGGPYTRFQRPVQISSAYLHDGGSYVTRWVCASYANNWCQFAKYTRTHTDRATDNDEVMFKVFITVISEVYTCTSVAFLYVCYVRDILCRQSY